jgi:hypothetical protein
MWILVGWIIPTAVGFLWEASGGVFFILLNFFSQSFPGSQTLPHRYARTFP